MISIGPDDPIEAVVAPSVNPDNTPATRGQAGIALVVFGLFFVGASFVRHDLALLFGIPGLMAICVGIQQIISSRVGYQVMPSQTVMCTVSALLCVAVSRGLRNADESFGSKAVGVFAAGFGIGAVFCFVRGRQEEAIARELRAAAARLGKTPETEEGSPLPVKIAANPPPLRLEIYLQRELSPPGNYQPGIGPQSNLIGAPPVRTLYLYNFFSTNVDDARWGGAWRRFGPVYFLGSPKAVSGGISWRQKVKKELSDLLLTTREAVDQYLAGAAESPLAPGDPGLSGYAFYAGGYPQHMLLCTDANWQHAVNLLFAKADFVVIDASNYRPARAGLNWEISHTVNHVPASKFVVLVDAATDQVALGEEFRRAWARMRDDSPNHRPDAAPVQFVVLEPRREVGLSDALDARADRETFPEEFAATAYGDVDALKQQNAFRLAKAWRTNAGRGYLREIYRAIPRADRVLQLLLQKSIHDGGNS